MVTYTDMFQFGIFIVALIGLCHNIFKRRKEKTKSKIMSYSLPFCTLFVSVDDKLVSILPYHRKTNVYTLPHF